MRIICFGWMRERINYIHLSCSIDSGLKIQDSRFMKKGKIKSFTDLKVWQEGHKSRREIVGMLSCPLINSMLPTSTQKITLKSFFQ